MALLKILQWLPLLTQDKSQSSDDGFKALHHFHQTSSFPSFTVSYATPATLASFIANHWGHSCLKPLVIPCVPSSPYLKLQNLHRLNTLHQRSIPFPSSLFSIALHSEYIWILLVWIVCYLSSSHCTSLSSSLKCKLDEGKNFHIFFFNAESTVHDTLLDI